MAAPSVKQEGLGLRGLRGCRQLRLPPEGCGQLRTDPPRALSCGCLPTARIIHLLHARSRLLLHLLLCCPLLLLLRLLPQRALPG